MTRLLLILFVCIVVFAGCDRKKAAPDVSDIEVSLQVVRTEPEIMAVHDRPTYDTLIKKHAAFYDIYLHEILPLYKGKQADSLYHSFQEFIQDSLVKDLFVKTESRYADFSDIKKNTEQMYRYLKYYFPEKSAVPNLYTFISQFGYQIFIFKDDDGKDGIGLGLDMFLHPEIDYKMIDPDNTNFSDYITRSWNKDHIVKKIADLHVNDLLGEAPGHRLIDQMIHNGKKMYVTGLLLPEVHDTIITEYTGKQLQWCQENELQMWSFFFDQKLFYESNPAKTGKYIHPSPKSPDMPDEAPGQTANYLGWQIVKAYMQKYPDTSIKSLLDMQDSQKLMEKSKFKPKQR